MANYTGRTTIFIPEQSSEITEKNVLDIMQGIMPSILSNFNDWNTLWRYYKGEQPILQKKRVTEPNEEKNNIVVENHAEYLVNFKSSYLISDGFKYSQTMDQRTDDVTQLNKYYIDEGKTAKDLDLAENVYVGGTGYKLTSPKTVDFDPEGESPFNIIILENNKTFVAYTTQPGHDAALSGYITALKPNEQGESVYQYTLYTDTKIFKFKANSDCTIADDEKVVVLENPLGSNPIVEYPLNKARIGVVDVAYSILNATNIVSSNQIDDIVDFVNSILVFYNVDIDKEKIQDTREIGALGVTDKNPQMQARVEYVANQLNHDGVNNLYDRLVKTVYGIVGVPIPSGQVTSGGDTGEARKLGGGYESADQIIKREEVAFINSERKSLKLELKICKTFKDCKINDLYSSEIQIRPTRHNLENILVKVQALSMLVAMDFPLEAALVTTGVGTSPYELAQQWEENRNKKEKKKEKNALDFANQAKSGEQPIDINKPNEPNDDGEKGENSNVEEK